jgi:hypothetical protein
MSDFLRALRSGRVLLMDGPIRAIRTTAIRAQLLPM